MKKILVNLKDWLDYSENVDYAMSIEGLDVTVFPSLPYLYIYKAHNVKIGSQKISSYKEGAHTGSVCAKHLKEFGVSSVILNHRECLIDESEKLIAKIENAQECDMEIVLCVGSSKKEELSKIEEALKKTGTKGISIAFEPYEDMELDETKVHLEMIKDFFKEFEVSYIYGSNITVQNFKRYSSELDVDGFLISSHALDPDNLKEMLSMRE